MACPLWACEWCLDRAETYVETSDGDLALGAGLYLTEAEALACEAKHAEDHEREQTANRKRHAETIAEGKRQRAAEQALLAETEAVTASPIGNAVLPADWMTMPIEELEAAVERNIADIRQRGGGDA